jgi:ribosome-associated protein
MNNEFESVEDTPSKSQRKREMSALQKLGATLTTFKNVQLAKLPLTDKLRDAIAEYNRIPNSHEGKRRQLQFIGRLMRDHDLASIQAAIEDLDKPATPKTAVLDETGEACSKILSEGDAAITPLLQSHQYLERAILRKFYLESRKIDATLHPERLEKIKQRLIKYLKKNI